MSISRASEASDHGNLATITERLKEISADELFCPAVARGVLVADANGGT